MDPLNGKIRFDIENRELLQHLAFLLKNLVTERKELVKLRDQEEFKNHNDQFYQKFAELDTKFDLEKVMDLIIEAQNGHPSADLFEQIFDHLEELRNNQTQEEDL